MTRFQSLYDRAPRLVQNAAVSTRGLVVRRQRMSRGFQRVLADCEATNGSPAQTEAVRRRRLESLLDRWDAGGTDRRQGSASVSERLEGCPVMTKAEVLADPARYWLTNGERAVPTTTGGSTGSPLRFLTTRAAINEQWAVWWRYRRWHGIDLDTWCGQFNAQPICPPGESSQFWRYNLAGRQVQFSYSHLTPETVERYVREIERRKLRWLHGHPSTLGLLATYMSEAGLRISHEVRWVTLCCENVADAVPPLISSVLETEVHQHYGQAEGVANLSECPTGRLHVDEDYSVVEFLPYEVAPGRNGSEQQLHRVVGTAITNGAQAFIRYDTSDLVSGIEEGCECGRPGRTVARIDGRTASFAVLPDGERIGPINQIFDGLPGIVQGQVFVTGSGGLVFHVVPGPHYAPAVADEITARTLRCSAQRLRVVVEPRWALQRGANGKVPVVIHGDPPS